MKYKLRALIPPLPGDRVRHRQASGDRVILLHGLWRSTWAMEGIAKAIHARGFETINLPYASFRQSMDEIVDGVAEVVRQFDDGKAVHFVTHSMGGIILRHLAHRFPEMVTGRVVMLAPPNQGSEVMDWLAGCPLSRWIFGPGGMSLRTQVVRQSVPVFAEEREVMVLMGRRSTIPFFQSLLEQENDGIVTVEGGRVEGMSEFAVVDGDHTLLMDEKEAQEKVIQFLEEGVLTEHLQKHSACP